jgi:hypothetical protein
MINLVLTIKEPGSSELLVISRFKKSATKVLKRVVPFQSLTIFNMYT